MKDIKYTRGKKFHFIKNIFPEGFVEGKSKKHFAYVLKDRWKYVKGQNLLDLGCGYGDFILLNPDKINVFGMDKKIPNLKNVKGGDLNKEIPFENNYFDTITMFHVIEHLENPLGALKEINKKLKDDGRLVVIVPNHSFKHFYDDYTHRRLYTKTSLYGILTDNGFSKVSIRNGFCFNPLFSLFFWTPRFRSFLEKFFGNFFPSEFIAVAEK